MKRPASMTNRTGVVVFTTDAAFDELAHATFTASAQIDLQVIATSMPEAADTFEAGNASVVIVDLDVSETRRSLPKRGCRRLPARLAIRQWDA